MRKHKTTVVHWQEMNKVLGSLQDDGCEILAVGPVKEHAGFIHYREKMQPLRSKSTIAVDKTEIEKIYKNYPRKIGKKAGIEKAIAKCQAGLPIKDLRQAVENFNEFVKDRQAKHIPYFSTFMNNQVDDFLPQNYEKTQKQTRYDLI